MNQVMESSSRLLPKAFIHRILGLSVSAEPYRIFCSINNHGFWAEEAKLRILHLVFRNRRSRVFAVTAWEKDITAARQNLKFRGSAL